jgi:hypothetical protein
VRRASGSLHCYHYLLFNFWASTSGRATRMQWRVLLGRSPKLLDVNCQAQGIGPSPVSRTAPSPPSLTDSSRCRCFHDDPSAHLTSPPPLQTDPDMTFDAGMHLASAASRCGSRLVAGMNDHGRMPAHVVLLRPTSKFCRFHPPETNRVMALVRQKRNVRSGGHPVKRAEYGAA